MLLTTLVGVLKNEKTFETQDNYVKINVTRNYQLLLEILKLPNIRLLGLALLTMDVSYISFIIKLHFN